MISNLILQETIDGVKASTGIDFSILELDGKTIASTAADMPVDKADVHEFIQAGEVSRVNQNSMYVKVYDEDQLLYVVVVYATNDIARTVSPIIAFQIRQLHVAYKEHYDKDNFIKNLLLDNLLVIDIYSRAKKLHISTNVKRVVFIVESENSKDSLPSEEIRQYFAASKTDFITEVDENSIIIIKELSESDGNKELDKLAKTILSIAKHGDNKALKIAYGNIVGEIKEVSRSYKEAKMALDIGKIFFTDEDVVAYSQLGIGRLIYQLPLPLCKMFIKEIFDKKSFDDFDELTITTINRFFENNLNVSETSRQLYIHRNTLVYRLDKLQKSTGLDLRVFDDAITFKIALMVVRYMKYMESLDY